MNYTIQKVKEVLNYYKDKIKMHKNISYSGNLKENINLFSEIDSLYPKMFKNITEMVYLLNYSADEKFCKDGNMLFFRGYKTGYSTYCKTGPICKKLRLKNWEDKFEKIHGVRKISDLPMMREKFADPEWGKMCRKHQLDTFKNKTGYDHPNKCPECIEKREQNNLKRIGVKHHWASKDPKLNGKAKRMELYGTENVFTLPEVREKATKARNTESWKQKVQDTRKLHSKEIFEQKHKHFEDLNKEFFEKNFIKDGKFDVIGCCQYFNITYRWALQKKRDFGIDCVNTTNKTKSQQEIYEFIKRFNIDAIFNDRKIIYPKELDIYIPSCKLAIEFNGLMPHSYGPSNYSAFNNFEEDSKRHLIKTTLCNKLGIKLLHIFENEWIEKQDIWKSVILSHIRKSNKIYARKCNIVLVNDCDKENFLNKNHLQGACPSSINIGLLYENRIVSLMTFGKSRFNNSYKWELLRFCSELNTTVVGGASKLLKYFRTHYEGSIISYANRRWSNGNLYEKLGFNKIAETQPNYFYFTENEYILWSRIKFQKHKLKSILPTYNDSLTETENMYNNGYRKIYDCGQLVFILP